MRLYEITITCDADGCDATATAVGAKEHVALRKLADQGWPRTRSIGDYCPQHRRKGDRDD